MHRQNLRPKRSPTVNADKKYSEDEVKAKAQQTKDAILKLYENFDPNETFDSKRFAHIEDRPLEIVLVAEKPQMAVTIIRILSNDDFKRDCSSVPPVHTCKEFLGLKANVKVTSTYGHLFDRDFVESNYEQHPFEAEIEDKEVKKENHRHVSFPEELERICIGCDVLILMLDNDMEGESICFEVINCVKNVLNRPPSGNVADSIFRAKFSSASEVKDALNNLVKPNLLVRLAMILKHDYDLRLGAAFSQNQSAFYRRHTEIKRVPFGPCISTCLGVIVDQYDIVKEYGQLPKYVLVFNLDLDDASKGEKLTVHSEPMDKETAESIYEAIKAEKVCKVTRVKLDHGLRKAAPNGLNAFELYKDGTKLHGIGSLAVAYAFQVMYLMGASTYARTESTKYPNDLDVKERIKQVIRNMRFLDVVIKGEFKNEDDYAEVLERGIDKLDHPAVTPTCDYDEYFLKFINESLDDKRWQPSEDLTDGEKRKLEEMKQQREILRSEYIYNCKHFLASFMKDCVYDRHVVEFAVGNFTFEYVHYEVLHPGYSELLEWEKIQEDGIENFAETFALGNEFHLFKVEAPKKSPSPSNLAEHELIQKMEDFSIGTDGSIPTHIDKLEKNGFVNVSKKDNVRYLEPSPLGIELFQYYKRIIPELINPQYRKDFEAAVSAVAKGEKDFVEVYEKYLKEMMVFYKKFNSNWLSILSTW